MAIPMIFCYLLSMGIFKKYFKSASKIAVTLQLSVLVLLGVLNVYKFQTYQHFAGVLYKWPQDYSESESLVNWFSQKYTKENSIVGFTKSVSGYVVFSLNRDTYELTNIQEMTRRAKAG